MKNYFKNQRGAIDIILIAVIAVLLAGLGGYVYYQQQQNNKAYDAAKGGVTVSKQTKKTASPAKSTSSYKTTSVTPTDGAAVTLRLPTGWTVIGGPEIVKTIGATKFMINVQITEDDYLQGNYGGKATVVKTVTDSAGKTLYVIKTADSYIALSSCSPENGDGCSLSQKGKPLLVLMHTYQSGDQYVREIDFNSKDTAQAIADFETMVEGIKY